MGLLREVETRRLKVAVGSGSRRYWMISLRHTHNKCASTGQTAQWTALQLSVRRLPAERGASRAVAELFSRSQGAFQRRLRDLEQERQGHNEKNLQLPNLLTRWKSRSLMPLENQSSRIAPTKFTGELINWTRVPPPVSARILRF